MIQRVLVPQAFENMEEATLGAWRRREGDALSLEDALCELITEKTTFDLPFEIAGSNLTLLHIAAPEKSVLPVGAVLALVGPPSTSGDDLHLAMEAAARDNHTLQQRRATSAPEESPSLSVPSLSVPSSTSGAPASISSSSGTSSGRLRATPAARRAAKDLGVDLEEVALKVPNKVLSEDDVRAFASA